MIRWRWWLALPVAVTLVLAASASKVHIFWWPDQLHDETRGTQGVPLRGVDVWTDEDEEEQRREFTVTLLDVSPATFVGGFDDPVRVEPPPGTAVWKVVLEFDVDPDVPMAFCQVSIVDQRGREAAADGGTVGETFLPLTACEPADRQGPLYDGTRPMDVKPRLPTYRVIVYAVTADDSVPASVRLWWEPPDYVELDVTG